MFLRTAPLTETPTPATEIEELRWQPLDGVEDVEDLAPLVRWYALPVVRGGVRPPIGLCDHRDGESRPFRRNQAIREGRRTI